MPAEGEAGGSLGQGIPPLQSLVTGDVALRLTWCLGPWVHWEPGESISRIRNVSAKCEACEMPQPPGMFLT